MVHTPLRLPAETPTSGGREAAGSPQHQESHGWRRAGRAAGCCRWSQHL